MLPIAYNSYLSMPMVFAFILLFMALGKQVDEVSSFVIPFNNGFYVYPTPVPTLPSRYTSVREKVTSSPVQLPDGTTLIQKTTTRTYYVGSRKVKEEKTTNYYGLDTSSGTSNEAQAQTPKPTASAFNPANGEIQGLPSLTFGVIPQGNAFKWPAKLPSTLPKPPLSTVSSSDKLPPRYPSTLPVGGGPTANTVPATPGTATPGTAAPGTNDSPPANSEALTLPAKLPSSILHDTAAPGSAAPSTAAPGTNDSPPANSEASTLPAKLPSSILHDTAAPGTAAPSTAAPDTNDSPPANSEALTLPAKRPSSTP